MCRGLVLTSHFFNIHGGLKMGEYTGVTVTIVDGTNIYKWVGAFSTMNLLNYIDAIVFVIGTWALFFSFSCTKLGGRFFSQFKGAG